MLLSKPANTQAVGKVCVQLISVADQAMYDAKTQSDDDAANDGSAFMGHNRQEN